MDKIYTKQQVRNKETIILFVMFLFLVFAYLSGNFPWMKDFYLLIDLFACIFALFIGNLAILRYYTKKSSINFLLLGLGFLSVSLLDGFHILASMNMFSDLIVSSPFQMFPSSMVLSRFFLALVFFLSWIFTQSEKKEQGGKDRIALTGFLIILSTFIIMVASFTKLFEGFESYTFAISMQTISLFIYLITLIGYTRDEGLYYRSFDFWIQFSLVFSILSQIFFLPYLNLEYELMLNLSTLSKLISYVVLLIGFLQSIYEMYKREEEVQRELERKNYLLRMTKEKVEEAYMVLREEKWNISKTGKKKATDKIFKDILKAK